MTEKQERVLLSNREIKHEMDSARSMVRGQIKDVLSRMGEYIVTGPDNAYVRRSFGPKGYLTAAVSENGQFLWFGVRILYGGTVATLVKAVLAFDDDQYWVESDLRKDLNALKIWNEGGETLFQNTLEFLRNFPLVSQAAH